MVGSATEARWRTPPVHFGTSVGMAPRMGISETGFALQENPIKRLWEDPKTGAKGAYDTVLNIADISYSIKKIAKSQKCDLPPDSPLSDYSHDGR